MVTKCGGVNQVLKCNITKYNGTWKRYYIRIIMMHSKCLRIGIFFTLNFLLNTNFTYDQKTECPIENTSSNRLSSENII